jgi:transposase
MPKPCSLELRERVVDAVESGSSRREAAEWFDVSPSSAIKWMQRRQKTGIIAAKPSGGSISPLEAHANFSLRLIAEQPDLTLDEIVAAMRKRRIAGSRSAVWRLFERHGISFKKTISDGVAPVGVETVGLYAALGRERPSAFWWRVTS